MRAAVERVRQAQDMLEVAAHRGEPAALREPVGVQCHQHAGADAGDADQAPQAEQQQGLPPGLGARACAAAGERVDDAAEQQRAEKAGRGESGVGDHQRDREVALRREQADHAAVESHDAHRQAKSNLDANAPSRRSSLRMS